MLYLCPWHVKLSNNGRSILYLKSFSHYSLHITYMILFVIVQLGRNGNDIFPFYWYKSHLYVCLKSIQGIACLKSIQGIAVLVSFLFSNLVRFICFHSSQNFVMLHGVCTTNLFFGTIRTIYMSSIFLTMYSKLLLNYFLKH